MVPSWLYQIICLYIITPNMVGEPGALIPQREVSCILILFSPSHINFICYIPEFLNWTLLSLYLDRPTVVDRDASNHYENMPIQIYRKYHFQKSENFQIKN